MILLDTHTMVWVASNDVQLGSQARVLIDDALSQGHLSVSVISFWEVAMLWQKGRLSLPHEPHIWRQTLLSTGLTEIPLTGSIAVHSTQLQDFHADPADRFIVATAIEYTAQLITADKLILKWEGVLLRHDARK